MPKGCSFFNNPSYQKLHLDLETQQLVPHHQDLAVVQDHNPLQVQLQLKYKQVIYL